MPGVTPRAAHLGERTGQSVYLIFLKKMNVFRTFTLTYCCTPFACVLLVEYSRVLVRVPGTSERYLSVQYTRSRTTTTVLLVVVLEYSRTGTCILAGYREYSRTSTVVLLVLKY